MRCEGSAWETPRAGFDLRFGSKPARGWGMRGELGKGKEKKAKQKKKD